MSTHTSLAASFAALALVAAPASAQDSTSGVRDLFHLESGGCESMFLDPKDAGLHEALHLLEDRLGELPAEIGESWSPDVMKLPLRLLYGPASLRVALDGDAYSTGRFPFRAQLELREESPEAAEALTMRATDFLMTTAPNLRKDIDASGFYRFNTGPTDVMYGVMESSYVVSVGAPRPTTSWGPSQLPAGVTSAMRMHLDLGRVVDLVAPRMKQGGVPFDVRQMFGIGDATVDWEFGVGADRSLGVSRTTGYGTMLNETSGMPEHMVNAAGLRAIPADAVWAALGVTNFEGTLDLIVEKMLLAAGPNDPFNGQDPLDAINGFIGLHLREDLVAHLGAQWGMYFSESTGGGGMASLVAFVELADAEGLTAGLERVEELLDSVGSMQAKGYVRVERRDLAGQDMWALSFPSIPVPIEFSMGIAGGHLVLGITPQAALAGMHQLSQGGPSLLDDPDFRQYVPELRGDELGLSFLDTGELLSDGYGWATLAASALSNGVRSRRDEGRQPGLVLPPFHELARGVRPTVAVARLDGEDLVSTAEMDRSMLVNFVAGMGWLERLPVAELIAFLGVAGVMDESGALDQMGGFGR